MGIATANLHPATADDLAPVRRLLADAHLPEDGLVDQFPAAYVVAATPAGLVGAAGIEVHGPDGLLRSVVVAPALRGTGLGKALVADRMTWARGQRLRAVYLLTTTAPDFFASLGFARLDRADAPEGIRASREFASICPGSSVCMSRKP